MLSTSKSILIILVLLFSSCFLSYSQITRQTLNNKSIIKNSEIKPEINKTPFLTTTHRDIKKGNLPYYLHHYILQNNTVPSFKLENVTTR